MKIKILVFTTIFALFLPNAYGESPVHFNCEYDVGQENCHREDNFIYCPISLTDDTSYLNDIIASIRAHNPNLTGQEMNMILGQTIVMTRVCHSSEEYVYVDTINLDRAIRIAELSVSIGVEAAISFLRERILFIEHDMIDYKMKSSIPYSQLKNVSLRVFPKKYPFDLNNSLKNEFPSTGELE